LNPSGVIVRERRGRYSYYRLVENALNQIAALVALPATQAAA
jgi:DNA-binding transcriptional regulator PaaX